jgi:hypothetical protein
MMDLTSPDAVVLLKMADDIRDLTWRMNAYEGVDSGKIQGNAYAHADHALSDIFGVLTEGKGDDFLWECHADNRCESTAKVLQIWLEFITCPVCKGNPDEDHCADCLECMEKHCKECQECECTCPEEQY